MQKTLVLLKPDCVERRLIGEIIGRFENKGLNIIAMKMLRNVTLIPEYEREELMEMAQRGLAAAHAAGMTCIAIPHALSRGSDFTRATRVLDSMEALAGVLELEVRG